MEGRPAEAIANRCIRSHASQDEKYNVLQCVIDVLYLSNGKIRFSKLVFKSIEQIILSKEKSHARSKYLSFLEKLVFSKKYLNLIGNSHIFEGSKSVS